MENTVTKPGFRKKFHRNEPFKMVLAIAIPIMIQNGITNFVSLLDNIAVVEGLAQSMSGAAIVNQLLFVYNLCLFGGTSERNLQLSMQIRGSLKAQQTFRYKLWLVIALSIITILILMCSGENLIGMYLKGEGSAAALEATSRYGMQYLWIMFIGLPPFMISQAYSSTLRECGETVQPMKAGVTAVLVNLVFNYLLIYGKFGFQS